MRLRYRFDLFYCIIFFNFFQSLGYQAQCHNDLTINNQLIHSKPQKHVQLRYQFYIEIHLLVVLFFILRAPAVINYRNNNHAVFQFPHIDL